MTIGIGWGKRKVLFNGNALWITINSSGGTENEVLDIVLFHNPAEDKCSSDVVMIVTEGNVYRFANRFQSGKMNHCVDGSIIEKSVQRFFIEEIDFVKPYFFAGEFLNPF